MAKRKEAADQRESAATVLAGEASLAGAKPSTKSVKKGKLPPKNKSRLPRRQKKAQQASIGAPVTDLASMNGTADMWTFVPDYMRAESWEKPETYIRHSPVYNARGVTTPALIQQGNQDTVVPLGQGEEYYNALRAQAVPVRMVVYPRSGHSPRESKILRHIMQENLDWFDKYLKAASSR